MRHPEVPTVTITVIIVLSVLVVPMLLSNTVEGQAVKTVSAHGSTNSGTLTCPDGTTTFTTDESVGEGIEFGGRTDSTNQGQWTIYELRDGDPPDSPGSYDIKRGTVTSVTIEGKNFVIQGTETTDEICGAPTEGTTISITGTCGKQGTITFTASNGEKGEYQGKVDCSTIQGRFR